MSRLAAIKEYAFMKALHAHGFPTPIPFDQNRHIVAMSRVAGRAPKSTTFALLRISFYVAQSCNIRLILYIVNSCHVYIFFFRRLSSTYTSFSISHTEFLSLSHSLSFSSLLYLFHYENATMLHHTNSKIYAKSRKP